MDTEIKTTVSGGDSSLALELKNITKTFGGKVIANNKVNLDLRQGEILALLGENGSGKTTLMNMIAGIYRQDEGDIFVRGEHAVINSPKDSFGYGIGMIHQHFKLVDLFTATENIVLGINDGKKYNIREASKRVAEIAEKYGFDIQPDRKIYTMSVSEKQTVEIIKVLYRGADILILDEPTAVLTPQEIDKLFNVLRRMRADGKSIIIITHKMNEVLSLSDRVAVLRKGEHIATVNTAETNESALTEMMVGKKVVLNIERSEPQNVQTRLEVRNLLVLNPEGRPVIKNVSFDVFSGEILGIAGIAGSGQRELFEAIAGLEPVKDGEVIFHNPKKDKPVSFFHKSYNRVVELAKEGKFHYADGTHVDFTGMSRSQIKKLVEEEKVLFYEDEIIDLRNKTPLQIKELGIRLSFVPEDRLGMGLVGSMNATDNMMLRSYRKGHSIFVDRDRPKKLAENIIRDLEVVTPGVTTPVRRLSGGNIQKLLVGREIASTPKVLMAAYPVRGLDINSSYLIYNLLNEQKKNGVAVIFVGEDLDVLLALCDRIMVISSGQITGILDGRTAVKEEVGKLMTKTEGAD